MPDAVTHSTHALRSRLVALGAIGLLALTLVVLLPPVAKANFIYWTNANQTTLGRAKLNGSGVNNAFIAGLSDVHGVTIDSKFIYWTQGAGVSTSSIGRANLDGSGANPNFIPPSAGLNFATPVPEADIAVSPSGIFWVNTGTGKIGRANLDGSSPNPSFVDPGPEPNCGLAADNNFIYWMDVALGQRIGRASQSGGAVNPSFIPGVSGTCGIAVDQSFIYYAATGKSVGRAPVGGGTANASFIPSAASSSNATCGVAVNSQYVFWGNSGPTDFIGRANLNGSGPNPGFMAGSTDPCLMVAAPSNKLTINGSKANKKKGTVTIKGKVPGPGQVNLTNDKPTAAKVKQQGVTLTAAGSFGIPVKAKGKTAKTLKKKGKAKATVYLTYTPAGTAGVPSTTKVVVHLQKKKKKRVAVGAAP